MSTQPEPLPCQWCGLDRQTKDCGGNEELFHCGSNDSWQSEYCVLNTECKELRERIERLEVATNDHRIREIQANSRADYLQKRVEELQCKNGELGILVVEALGEHDRLREALRRVEESAALVAQSELVAGDVMQMVRIVIKGLGAIANRALAEQKGKP